MHPMEKVAKIVQQKTRRVKKAPCLPGALSASRVADSALPHWDGETERAVCGMRLDAKGFSHWQCEGISVNILVRTKNKASRTVSMDISLGTARSTSSSESVTPQTSVHFKCALLHVNEMRFTADRRSIRRYNLEKDLL